MKKLMVCFVALAFFATFSLMGCNQSQPPAKPAAEKGEKEQSEPLEPLEPLERLEPRSPWSTCTRKKIDAGYRGISSPRGYTL